MRGRVGNRLSKSGPLRGRDSGRSAFLACAAALLIWFAIRPDVGVAGDKQKSSSRSHENAITKQSSGDTSIISLQDLPSGARPANLYRLESSTSDVCPKILDALNTAHRATRYEYGRRGVYDYFTVSDMFLESALSVKWIRLDAPTWLGAAKVNIDSTGPEEWIVKEVMSGSKPRYYEFLYWLEPGIDPTKLKGSKLHWAILGQDEKRPGVATNAIELLPVQPGTPLRQIPVELWDVITVDGRSLALLMLVKNDPSPQRLAVRVLAMRDRTSADDICRIETKSLISGFSF